MDQSHILFQRRGCGQASLLKVIKMMTLQEILAKEESQTFDRKSINVDAKGLAVAISAMANADGGDIVVGLSDKNRRVEGVSQATEHVNDLLRVPFDFCTPSVEAQGLGPVKYSQQDFMTLATAYNQSEQSRESAEIGQKPLIDAPISGFPGSESADFLSANTQTDDNQMVVKLTKVERKPLIQEQNSGFYNSTNNLLKGESADFTVAETLRLPVCNVLDMAKVKRQLTHLKSKRPTIVKIMRLCEAIRVNEVFGSKLVSQILYCSETQARAILNKLKELGLIKPVAKQGKGKYIFIQ